MKFLHQHRRISGLVLPLSSLRCEASPGCGEFPDLARAGDLASAWGFELIQLLPVNDSGFQNSPYSALSAFALHPIYIRIADLPELAAGVGGEGRDRTLELRTEADALVSRFSGEERVPHEALLRAKIELLRKVWSLANARSGSAGRDLQRDLDEWIEANPWSKSYAAFVVLKTMYDERPWWEWPRQRDPSAEDIDNLWKDRALIDDLRFWSWLQMRASGQFRASPEHLAAEGIALMGDIPILMNADSADVWARRECFGSNCARALRPICIRIWAKTGTSRSTTGPRSRGGGYGFWAERLAEADKYYSCYRIDHVLGFFHIWALSERESSGAMGRFIPDVPMVGSELEALGFDAGRIIWMSRPHLPTWRLVQAAGESAAKGAASAALERIGEEELFLFKDSIRGEKDIESLPSISPAARDCLLAAWRDRALFEFEPGSFAHTWNYRSASCWPTLSDEERGKLESLFSEKRARAEELWAATGKSLLGAIVKFVPMLPCAEDLGSVPDCVPKVLEDLGILGLRVFRWARRWNEGGRPYIPVQEYPELSVACLSVHDSSSIREWWETEADREETWRFAGVSLGRDLGPCPARLDPEHAASLMELIARSASRFAVYPIQDILALSEKLRPADPKSERINIPGTVGIGNWSYRVPPSIDEILADKKLAAKVRALAKARRASDKTGKKLP